MLFAEGAIPADIVVHDQGGFKWLNQKLEASTRLPTRDKMFIDNVIQKVLATDSDEKYIGSDTWIRSMFTKYTLSLLSVMADSNFGTEPTASVYNQSWVDLWKTTNNFQKWKDSVDRLEVVTAVRPVHLEHDTKTELDELQEAVSQQASRVGNYLWSFYESASAGTPTAPPSENTSDNPTTPREAADTTQQQNDSKTDYIKSLFGWNSKEIDPNATPLSPRSYAQSTKYEDSNTKDDNNTVDEGKEISTNNETNVNIDNESIPKQDDETTDRTSQETNKDGVGEFLTSYFGAGENNPVKSFLDSFWTKK